MTIDFPRDGQIPALRQLWQKAFWDSDDFLDGFFSVGFAPKRCRVLLANGEIAAALYWFDCQWEEKKVAYLYAIATDPANQGKGFCRQLVENTHAHLRSLGYSGAILVPGDGSLFSLYEKLNYTPCCGVQTKTILAGQAPAPFTQIGASTYASLQKKFAPQGRVFHSQSTLAFASTFNRFYEGQSFAFCGATDEDTFFFQSFVGDSTALPGILAALGVEKGAVRLPGKTPYAMYYSLDGDSRLPEAFEIPLN